MIKISLKFVPSVPIINIPALVQIMAWRRPGDKPLSEPIMVTLLTHICVTRPQGNKHKSGTNLGGKRFVHGTKYRKDNQSIHPIYWNYMYVFVRQSIYQMYMIDDMSQWRRGQTPDATKNSMAALLGTPTDVDGSKLLLTLIIRVSSMNWR